MVEHISGHITENEIRCSRQAFVFLGPPTSGKTSAVSALEQSLQLPVIRGREVAQIATQNAGSLRANRDIVSDDLFIPALQVMLCEIDPSNGVIFENIPRTVLQAEGLVEWATQTGMNFNVVNLHLEISDVIDRAAYRLECPCCGGSYHPTIKPPVLEGYCDKDSNQLVRRDGDTPDKIKKAYERYLSERDILLNTLGQMGTVHNIDAAGPVSGTMQKLYSQLFKDI